MRSQNEKIKQSNAAQDAETPWDAAVYAVESRILFLRHQRVILDADIAELYGVPVKRLNEQVKRNQERFPSDFMFQLTTKEHDVFEVAICDLKEKPRWAAVSAVCVH